MVGAVILAAGAGRRMGGVPKALLTLEGHTFLELVIDACTESGCNRILVVVAKKANDVRDLARLLDAEVAVNLEPELGMFSSVKAGLASLGERKPEIDAIVIFPVDHPNVAPETVALLLEKFDSRPERTWVRPVYMGRGGHPVVIDTETAGKLVACEPTDSFRDALVSCGYKPYSIAVDDPGVVRNINTPDDYQP